MKLWLALLFSLTFVEVVASTGVLEVEVDASSATPSLSSSTATASGSDGETCPVCVRVVRAARELGRVQQKDVSSVLSSYCSLSNIEVAEQKFCYNTENVRGQITRLINLGADESRICKKVKAMNPDFCKVMSTKKVEGVHHNDRLIKGVIYE
jgi:hypothetical protein